MKKILFVAFSGILVACGESNTSTTTDSTAVTVDSTVIADTAVVKKDTTIIVDSAAALKDTTSTH